MSKRWNRPKLPISKNGSGVVVAGAWLVASGVALMALTLAGVFLPFVAPLAGAAASCGVLVVLAGLIIREIRQAAFEAAIRADELTTE